ncbi:MAG: FMN-binding glutamate synthase family protein [Candidatus Latescibacteria bacterium]|nr:FMN-binding glutamate synthase family protein [Candidatus Latescibacterota bacterium]
MRSQFVVISLLVVAGISALALLVWPPAWWAMVVVGPIVVLGLYDMVQTKRTIVRNFPLLGRGRYIMEALRPKIYQYFVESDLDGTPISRVFRSVVYQRAKKELDTIPFGTEFDVYATGYEWMNHSLGAHHPEPGQTDLRVQVGGPDCSQPYSASILNISAMSYGALSKNAVLALNGGAQLGGFAHNTGEGSISPFHREPGGDLIWQIGTGYFGCRAPDGGFASELFAERAAYDQVKMIEIKLSQGAKPGHGGILPASKNTPEIAQIRTVEPHTDVVSPPGHAAFSTPLELVHFVKQLRDLSGGKPIGFKLCLGVRSEFIAVCKAMVETGIKPDFITVDGGEGGTGAAPPEYSNSVGTPLREGLAFVIDVLHGFDLKKDVRVIASGKILTGFHVARALALGADMANSARGMMLALGCIQALECNQNICPTGITTQDPGLVKGLVVGDKRQRVANFHHETVKSVAELLAASGLKQPDQLDRSYVFRRTSMHEVSRYDEIYPYIGIGCLLAGDVPEWLQRDFDEATSDSFMPLRVGA